MTEENSQGSENNFEESSDNVLEECFRIFEEFEFESTDIKTQQIPHKAEQHAVREKAPVEHDDVTVAASSIKKRIAHEAAALKPPLAKTRRIRPVSATAGQVKLFIYLELLFINL